MKNSKLVVLVVAISWAVSLFLMSYYSWQRGRDIGLEIGVIRGMKAQQLAFEITLARLEEREKNSPDKKADGDD